MAIDVGQLAKGVAVGYLGKQLRRVAGNIGAVLGGAISGDSSDYEKINRSKQSTNMLSFPLDIGADPGVGNHGHYIMFYINEQKGNKLGWNGAPDKGKDIDEANENVEKEANKRYSPAASEAFSGKSPMNILIKDVFVPASPKFKEMRAKKFKQVSKLKQGLAPKGKNTVYIDRAATTRLDTVITMFMPPSIKTEYKANYTDQSIGSAAKLATGLHSDVTSATFKTTVDNLQQNAGEVADMVAHDKALELFGVLPTMGGLKEAAEMRAGSIISDRLELAFKGIEKRTFQYEFKMIPRSEAEADEIREIISLFKFHMLPATLDKGRGKLLTVPSTFDIDYMFMGSKNNYLNKISTCFLESMGVSYGDSKFKVHDASTTVDGASPVETTITLNFREIELITRERAAEGF